MLRVSFELFIVTFEHFVHNWSFSVDCTLMRTTFFVLRSLEFLNELFDGEHMFWSIHQSFRNHFSFSSSVNRWEFLFPSIFMNQSIIPYLHHSLRIFLFLFSLQSIRLLFTYYSLLIFKKILISWDSSLTKWITNQDSTFFFLYQDMTSLSSPCGCPVISLSFSILTES